MGGFDSDRGYLDALTQRCLLPDGFQTATTRIEFVPEQRPDRAPYTMDLSLIVADEPLSVFGGCFTKNRIPGASIMIARRRMQHDLLQAILINNRIANVATENGIEDATLIANMMGKHLSIDERLVLSISTGIIGWPLPVFDIIEALPSLREGLHYGSAIDLARAIMTTDSFPKARRVAIGDATITAFAKGAGMIEPNMSTMLIFILTDVIVEREMARDALRNAVDGSFNAISIDGSQSTSDMVLLLSTGRHHGVPFDLFQSRLMEICRELAEDIVRNGEGVGHVIEVRVEGARNILEARSLGKAIVNSPLVGTAIYGNDPNVGRIVSAIGDWADRGGVDIDPGRLTIKIDTLMVFTEGAFHLDRRKEIWLASYLQRASMNPRLKGYPQHDEKVRIGINLSMGSDAATILGTDLSHEYIHENADYRS